MVPTTSQPPRRTSSRGSTPQGSPLKGISLKVTVNGPSGKQVARLAVSKGLSVEEDGGSISIVISTATPEEALEKLGVVSGILAART